MSNSSMVSYTKISPNKNVPRNHAIDTITIHHMAGNLTVETCGNVFAPSSRQASSNYGIGTDGRVGMYVEEKDRSWASSNKVNDHRAITIEVADDTADYHVSDKAIATLVDLCADICRRNGIGKLVWSWIKDDRINHRNGCNMTVHRDFVATSCPGDYLYGKMEYIASEVNKKLGGAVTIPTVQAASTTASKKSIDEIAQEIIAGKWGNGQDRASRLTAAGYDANSVQSKVNQLCGVKASTPVQAEPAKKTNDEVAQEVINGKWGNGTDRQNRLKAAGYDPNTIQSIVNAKLSGKSTNATSNKKSNTTIAQEVIAGKWGNGQDRINRLYAAGYNPSAVQKEVNRLCK